MEQRISFWVDAQFPWVIWYMHFCGLWDQCEQAWWRYLQKDLGNDALDKQLFGTKPEDIETPWHVSRLLYLTWNQKCCQRFKEFYNGGWFLLESLLVESQMGVRVTVFCCPENHSLLRFKELGIAHIVGGYYRSFVGRVHMVQARRWSRFWDVLLEDVLMVKQLISKPPKDETKSRPRTKNPYLLKADTRSGVEIETEMSIYRYRSCWVSLSLPRLCLSFPKHIQSKLKPWTSTFT